MPQVPLPRVGLSTPAGARYEAPSGVIPIGDVAGKQAQQTGAAVTKASAAVVQIAVGMNEEHALAVSKKSLNEFSEVADAQVREFQNLIGQDLFEVDGKEVAAGVAPKKRVDFLEAQIKEIEAKMSSELGKRMFRQAAERSMVGVKSSLFGHEATQLRVFNDSQNVAALERHKNRYVVERQPVAVPRVVVAAGEANAKQSVTGVPPTAAPPTTAPAATPPTADPTTPPTDPTAAPGAEGLGLPTDPEEPKPPWREHYESAVQYVEQIANDRGYGKEQRAAFLLEQKTDMNSGYAQKLLVDGKTKEAKKFLEDLPEGEINQLEAARLNKLVRDASVSDDALRLAISLKDTHDVDQNKRLDIVEVNAIGDEVQKRFLEEEFDAKTRDKILTYVKEMLGRHGTEAAHKTAEAKAKAEGRKAASKNAKELAEIDAFIGLGPKPTRSKLAKIVSELPDKLRLAVETGKLTEEEADGLKNIGGAIRWVLGAAAPSMSAEIEEGMKAAAKPPHSSTSEWVRQMEIQGVQKAKEMYPNDERLQIDFVMAHTAAIKKQYDLAVEKVDAQKAEIQDEMGRYIEFNDVTDADAVPWATRSRWAAANLMGDARKLVKARTENRNDSESLALFQASLQPVIPGSDSSKLRFMPTAQFNSMVAGLKGKWKERAKQARLDAQASTPLQNSPLNQMLRVMKNRGEFTGKGTRTQPVVADPDKPWEVSLMGHLIEEWHDRLDVAQAELDRTRSGAKLTDQEKLNIGFRMVVELGDDSIPQRGTRYERAEEITTYQYKGTWVFGGEGKQTLYEWHYKRMSQKELLDLLGQAPTEIGVYGIDPKTKEEIWIETEPELDLPKKMNREARNRIDDEHRANIVQEIARGDTSLRTHPRTNKKTPVPTKEDLELIKALVDSAPTERTEERHELDRLFRKYGVTDRVPIGELKQRHEEIKLEDKTEEATALLDSDAYKPWVKKLQKKLQKAGLPKDQAKAAARAEMFKRLMQAPGAIE